VELRHLRAFEVVAQELSFTRAAVRLHLSQQALSAQIRDLEERVGTALFERSTRSVRLTEPGRTLLQHVPGILLSVGQALAETRRSAVPRRSLVVGLGGTGGLPTTTAILRAFGAAHPDVEVTARSVDFRDASGALASGGTDVAILWLPASAGLEATVLLEDERLAVLPADHPLAAQGVVHAADLADEPFVWVDEMDARVRDFWTLAEYRVGRPVRVGARVSNMEDSFSAIAAGLAVAASPASLLTRLPETIVTRPVRGLTPAQLGVVRRAGDDRELVRAFVAVAARHTTR
jgi:DNA-binding transcriptional LysR family regulator